MGLYVNLLEPGRCAAQLLPLFNLPSQSPTFGLPLESYCSESPLHLLPVRVLGLGYRQRTKESIQTVGARYPIQQENISPIAMARPRQSKDHPDRPGRCSSGGWLVYVDHLGVLESILISSIDGMARKIHYTCDLYFVSGF